MCELNECCIDDPINSVDIGGSRSVRGHSAIGPSTERGVVAEEVQVQLLGTAEVPLSTALNSRTPPPELYSSSCPLTGYMQWLDLCACVNKS